MKKGWDFGGVFVVCHILLVCIAKMFIGLLIHSVIFWGGGNIKFDNSSLNVFQNSGCYFQGFENITIGKNVWIAQNVGIITANHDLVNPDLHAEGKPVHIGDKCWIGMNAVILPGVVLGENTIVGAGSVVTKSFEQGHCVVVGNPARVIKTL